MSTTSPNDDTADYVRSAARFLDLPLDEAQVQRVAGHLARTKAMVALLRDAPLADDLEPAEVYCPAPFPDDDVEAYAP
jgi:hypothetical protein